MRSLIVFVLPLLLLAGCGSKSPEGKWTFEAPGKPGSGEKVTVTAEFKADGAFSAGPEGAGNEKEKETGTWKKLDDKTIEITTTRGDKKDTVKAVFVDDKTMELDTGKTKIKLTKAK